MDNEWKPIETAPASGEFLVRGGLLQTELGDIDEYTVAHVNAGPMIFLYPVCNVCGYSVWVLDPTEWKSI